MNSPLHSIALAVAALTLAPAAFAQAPAPAQTAASAATPVEEAPLPVVVTATRTQEALKNLPQRAEVVTRKQIAATPHHELVDLLHKTSNVDITQYPGGLSGIAMRGFSPTAPMTGEPMQTLVLQNGVPMISNALSTIPSSGVARVEVLRGPASALYGSQAMSGVINMVPVRRTGELRGGVGVGVGSFHTGELHADIGGSLTPWFNFDYFGSLQKQGDYRYPGGTAKNSALRKDSHSLRLGFELSPNWTLDARGDWFRGKGVQNPGALPGFSGTPSVKDSERDLYSLALRGALSNHTISATAYTGREKENLFDVVPGVPPALSFTSNSRWHGLQVKDEWEWKPGYKLVYGLDTNQTQVSSISYWGGQPSVYQPDSKQTNTALYAQQSMALNDGKTHVYVGGRYDWFKLSTLPTSLLATNTPQNRTFQQFSPSIGIKHHFTPMIAVHATAGKGFAAPSAWKMAGNYDTAFTKYRGNPDLKPESSVSADVGLSLEQENWNADITYYDTTVNNKIVTTNLPGGITSWDNANKARMQGIELTGRWAITPHLALGLGYTHSLKAQENSAGVWKDLQHVPQQTARISLDGQWGAFSGRLAARYTGKARKTAYFANWATPPLQKVYPGYTLVDASVRYQIAKQHSVSLSVNNLFNQYYESIPGYPMPGREIKLAYRWDFE